MDDDNRIIDELLEALLAADSTKNVGLTTKELSEMLGWSDDKVRSRLKELKRSGKIVATLVRREILDGRAMLIPAYRMAD